MEFNHAVVTFCCFGWMDEWMDGWVVGWIDGWIGGWMDGWMDGRSTENPGLNWLK